MSITSYYCVVRYVPDDIRDEGVNIGVVLEAKDAGNELKECLFAKSIQRAAKLDPYLKSAALERIIGNALTQIRNEAAHCSLYELAANYSGGKIQFTKPRLTLVDDFKKEATELFSQYVIDEREERRHGITEPILKRGVKDVLVAHGISAERFRYSTNKEPVNVAGRRATHAFDLSVKVNSHHGFIRCISFDVEEYVPKMTAAKALIFDAKDIKEKHQKADIISILQPPKNYPGKEREQAYREARTILNEEGVHAFNFASATGQKELLDFVNQ